MNFILNTNLSNFFDNLQNRFIKSYNKKGHSFDINIIQIIIVLFFIYKLLSRDFSFFGIVPDDVFGNRSISQIYPVNNIKLVSIQFLNELATFQFIHYFID